MWGIRIDPVFGTVDLIIIVALIVLNVWLIWRGRYGTLRAKREGGVQAPSESVSVPAGEGTCHFDSRGRIRPDAWDSVHEDADANSCR